MYAPEFKKTRLYELNMQANDPPSAVQGLDEQLMFTAPTPMPQGKGLIVVTRR
jgi:hypothetical protein